MNNNELIAEFMGFTHTSTEQDTFWSKPDSPMATIYDWDYHTLGLEFDKSWDWLMPVVEKIEKMEGVRVIIKGSRCRILAGKKVFSCHTISKLNSMYRVVVEFIEWYNKQKS